MGKCFDPIHHLVKALELEPHHHKAALMHAKLLLHRGEAHTAITFIKNFLDQSTSQPDLQNLLARAYLKTGNMQKAEEAVNQALSELPRSKEVLLTAFKIKKAKGDKFSALHFLERIIRYDDKSFEIFWEMALLLDRNTETKKRINILEISHSLNPQSLEIFEELLVTYKDHLAKASSYEKDPLSIKAVTEHSRNPLFFNLSPKLQKSILLIVEEPNAH